MEKKAVFVSAIDFESPIQIGDHQLARQFAAHGWKVAFLSRPVTPFHFLSKEKEATSRRFANHRVGGIFHKIDSGEIWSYVPLALITPQHLPVLRNNWIYHHWQYSLIPNVTILLKNKGFAEVDLLFIRDPLQSYILQQIKATQSFFRLSDNDAGFETFNRFYADLEKETVQKVDRVLYSARELEGYVQKLNPKQADYLPNGVNFHHFAFSHSSCPDLYKNLKRPIVVYAGSIDFWFDTDLVLRLAKELKEFSFILIGPNQKADPRLRNQKNIILTGGVTYTDLPAYLTNANVGLIPFNVASYPTLVNSISPIKLYEYLACGLPVVSTRWKEIEYLRSPAYLCDSFEQFVSAIHMAVSEKDQSSRYRNFAAQNDWTYRYKEIIKIMG